MQKRFSFLQVLSTLYMINRGILWQNMQLCLLLLSECLCLVLTYSTISITSPSYRKQSKMMPKWPCGLTLMGARAMLSSTISQIISSPSPVRVMPVYLQVLLFWQNFSFSHHHSCWHHFNHYLVTVSMMGTWADEGLMHTTSNPSILSWYLHTKLLIMWLKSSGKLNG